MEEHSEKLLKAKHIERYRRHVVIYAFLVAVTSFFSTVDGFVYPYPESLKVAVRFYQSISFGVFFVTVVSLVLLRFGRFFTVLRYGVWGATLLFISTLTILTGMQTDMDIMHVLVLMGSPFIVFSWQERVHVLVSLVFSVVTIILVKFLVESVGGILILPEDVVSSARMATWFLAFLLGVYLAYTLFSVDKNQMWLLKERKKVDDLLCNVMPEVIADRLKAGGGGVIAESHENVSVLFADLKGFTAWCHGRDARATFEALDGLVRLFDEVVSQNGGEKIKTIGDGYMAAWGVPKDCKDHALQALRAGYGMIHALESHTLYTRDGVGMRVGIHSGMVTAGIIGRDKFAYDLWGDTVNTASRMEQKCAPMKVTVSSETMSYVRESMEEGEYEGEYLGEVSVKGKGDMEIWQVNEGVKKEGV
jgi:class 3 adenylate cyclase